MYLALIDDGGYIDNPHSSSGSPGAGKKLWGAIVCRRGRKARILSFLDRDDACRKVNVGGVPRGVYLAFGANREQEWSLYLITEVTDRSISLRPVDVTDVPRARDMEQMASTHNYILAANKTLLELQIEALREEIGDLRSKCVACKAGSR
jgi:hypothetical protein